MRSVSLHRLKYQNNRFADIIEKQGNLTSPEGVEISRTKFN